MTEPTVPGKDAGLNDWLNYVEKLHDKPIDLGLARMKTMISRMGIDLPGVVYTVAGTNGKGSTCSYIESILLHSGHKVGLHTSPHILRFNERVRVNGEEVDDATIIKALKAVNKARGDMTLSYFEFTGLAILKIFMDSELDAVILEIGLGGRLDAMNAIDSDIAVVSSVGIDHVGFLGDSREKIGFEKAGIFRRNQYAVCADQDPPQSLVDYAFMINSHLRCINRDFEILEHGKHFDFRIALHDGSGFDWMNLPKPGMKGEHQMRNAAGALAALALTMDRISVTRSAVVEGLEHCRVTGRFQTVSQDPEIIIDVGHNPQAAEALALTLKQSAEKGRMTRAVFGMLKDKDMKSVVSAVAPQIDHWYVGGLGGDRGASSSELVAKMFEAGVPSGSISRFDTVSEAFEKAKSENAERGNTGRIVVFGSFLTVAEAMQS